VNTRIKLLCAWSGPALAILTTLGLALANVIPVPPGANLDPQGIAQFYTQSSTRTLVGFALASVSIGLIFPLVALIAVHMVRMEGRTPLLTFLQMVTGSACGVFLIVPMIMMGVCAFRPERSPELIQLLNDFAWMMFITPLAPFCIQNVAIALAIFNDRNPQPVLPRWVAYGNLWVAFLFLPSILPYFFYDGPFAWQGIFVFWLAFIAYASWAMGMGLVLRRAVLREEAAFAGLPSAAAA
jgi:hypothetical protein